MRAWLLDIVIGIGIGMAVAALVMLSSFNSTFIYRMF